MYTYEMHCHSSQCSACGRSTAQELVRAYYEAGFAGMVLTDHFVTGNTAIDRNLPWEEQMKAYYKAYEDACSAAKALDFDVLFGIEHAYGDGKEVLVYGIDLEFLLNNPDLAEISLDEFVERVHEDGGIVIQAHPYRDRSYVNMNIGPRRDIVDGIEVYNSGNLPGEDKKALALSQEKDYIITSGGDIHSVNNLKLGSAGVCFSKRIKNSAELVEALQKNVCGYIVEGKQLTKISAMDLPG